MVTVAEFLKDETRRDAVLLINDTIGRLDVAEISPAHVNIVIARMGDADEAQRNSVINVISGMVPFKIQAMEFKRRRCSMSEDVNELLAHFRCLSVESPLLFAAFIDVDMRKVLGAFWGYIRNGALSVDGVNVKLGAFPISLLPDERPENERIWSIGPAEAEYQISEILGTRVPCDVFCEKIGVLVRQKYADK